MEYGLMGGDFDCLGVDFDGRDGFESLSKGAVF